MRRSPEPGAVPVNESEASNDTLVAILGALASAAGCSVTLTVTPAGYFDDEPDAPAAPAAPEFAEVEERRETDGEAVTVAAMKSYFEVRQPVFHYQQRVVLATSLPAFHEAEAERIDDEREDKARAAANSEGRTIAFARPITRLRSFSRPVEEGTIIGISTYCNGSLPSYLVRYRAGDGRQVEQWHSEDAIVAMPEPAKDESDYR